ncbi:MAG: hypothetical protein AB7I50_15225 [Vicinamibacterales bacterium]
MRAHLTLFVVLAAVSPAFAQSGAAPAKPSQADADLACSPRVAALDYSGAIRVLGSLDHSTRYLVGTDERIVVDAGTDRNLTVGSQHLIRRWRRPGTGERSASVDTAGWVVIESVQDQTATARVIWACDGVEEGDFLEPYAAATVVSSRGAGMPDFERPGVVRAGRDSRVLSGIGERVLAEFGAAGDVAPGQRVTFFRYPRANRERSGPTLLVGEGYVLEMNGASAVVQIDRAVTAVEATDLVAVQR